MISRYEDLAGKAVLTVIFILLAAMQAHSITLILAHRESLDLWPILLAGRVAGLAFLALVAVLTIMRDNPKNVRAGWEPRVTSVVGTFCMVFLVVLPTGEPAIEIGILANTLIVVGTILSIWCAIYLGRSFSVMAAARNLVVQGPYAHVRHPLYAAEAVTILGTVLNSWSLQATLLGMVWCALQYRRMQHEERILRSTFPEYEEYARNVSMIVPSPIAYHPSWGQAHSPR